ncbi:cell wall metabolism sensor histidine kinase WalK [Tychonema sp. LEGE 07203]|uniref:sensor histidine kinase n=1 Tax=Tychonema sp. LEGE 07203 TaxID=1828671 RepID=UPI0018810FAF|nr:HAMP domain-containing sensor histidine kinase [Tychonema sp. LEGE 07203]MBE9096464.1 HAMP domain-containing histidine kinase [Tychonema sp. LEGE 07203]
MAWVIGSTKTSNPQFQALGWRLLLSYLTVMVAILGASAIAVYDFFYSSLYQELDQRLEVLAQAASHSLVAIEKQHFSENPEKDDESDKQSEQSNDDFQITLDLEKVTPQLDKDGDLDIPWQNLREPDQAVEWFDRAGEMLGNSGKTLPPVPIKSGFQTIQDGKTRSATIPVYIFSDDKSQELKGYIRTSESTKEVEEVLSRLRWKLGYGSIICLSLTAVGGLWLTKQSLKPIEESFQQLKQFTADASHELRSPLTAIKTSVEVMQSHPERIHAADVKKMAAIASATKQMTQLVEDLLLLTRMDAPAATIVRESIAVPLDELLEDLLDLWELQAQEKQIILKSNLAINTSVMGDAAQLSRLFCNLIGNAIHYTPAGGIVTVSLSRKNRSTIVSVEDTGIGIAPEDVKLVFNRFWRADRARNRRAGGLGMGLAIAQAIVQSHRGEISVTSQLGVGSCFQVKFSSVA